MVTSDIGVVQMPYNHVITLLIFAVGAPRGCLRQPCITAVLLQFLLERKQGTPGPAPAEPSSDEGVFYAEVLPSGGIDGDTYRARALLHGSDCAVSAPVALNLHAGPDDAPEEVVKMQTVIEHLQHSTGQPSRKRPRHSRAQMPLPQPRAQVPLPQSRAEAPLPPQPRPEASPLSALQRPLHGLRPVSGTLGTGLKHSQTYSQTDLVKRDGS
ncbi:MAG: hypothetical protein MHM6MM_006022 [Cercozoa sp. M6MM]